MPARTPDLVLLSSDDVEFNVHSLILKMSSPVFGDMLRTPRSQATSTESAAEAVVLAEPAAVLSLLLDIVYPGRGQLQNVDFGGHLLLLKATGLAAIKYDMWAALEAIKAFLVSPASIAKYPSVRLYGIAWDLHFSRETMILSTETLKSNLNTTENQMHLEKLDVIAVLNLLRLHRERKVIHA